MSQGYTGKQISVSHFVGLSGIGGVQRNFTEHLEYLKLNPGEFSHKVYTFGEIDREYVLSVSVFDIGKIFNFFSLIKDLISSDTIVHFYNNLSSYKVAILLFFLPVSKLIIHERGTAWNQPKKKGFITRFNANKASVILSNSKATKTMLVKKFLINEDKITIIYNGIDINTKCISKDKLEKNHDTFRVGFIGRLDSPKGVNVLIKAMQHLKKYKVMLLIAGSGPLLSALKKQSNFCDNITFIGRVQSPHVFLNQIDLLVVPSIREPLGNVCIEAGLCRTPVLASNVDGIPEIIKHKVSGELMTPTDNLTIHYVPNMAPIPEYVVNPRTQGLQSPMQLNDIRLAEKILELSKNVKKLNEYGSELHNTIVNRFSIEHYNSFLENVYKDLYYSKN